MSTIKKLKQYTHQNLEIRKWQKQVHCLHMNVG